MTGRDNILTEDVAGPAADVELKLTGLPVPDGKLAARQYPVAADHANCYEAWKRMGEPLPPSATQYAALQAASRLATLRDPGNLPVTQGQTNVHLTVPRQGVTLLVLTWRE